MLALLSLLVGGTLTACVTEDLGPEEVTRLTERDESQPLRDVPTAEQEAGSIDPDEIDARCDAETDDATTRDTETGSIDPDEIDCDAGDTTETEAKITYGPVITIKPKG